MKRIIEAIQEKQQLMINDDFIVNLTHSADGMLTEQLKPGHMVTKNILQEVFTIICIYCNVAGHGTDPHDHLTIQTKA